MKNPLRVLGGYLKKGRHHHMAVTPLATPPVPPNSNLNRAMIVWVTTTASQDPLDTDTDQQNLINFCGTQGVNLVFLDMFNYLGAANWTAAKLVRLRKFLAAAKASGIEVWAFAGSPDWCHAESWVMKNIIQNVMWFQEQATKPGELFDGFFYDVEYWNDSGMTQPVACAALCDMMRVTRARLGIRVGCTATYWLKDNTGTRSTFTYRGKTAQDGEFLVDEADLVLVPCYRNHAQDNGTDGAGQISLMQAWYDYASAAGNGKPILCASETTNVSPSYVTYFGMTKAAMEAQHTLISNQFTSSNNAVFAGQCVHSYDGWKAMT